jgi:hypothetical protein
MQDTVEGTKQAALATDNQAIARAHRQGQGKQITIVRLFSPTWISTIKLTFYSDS